MVIDRFSGACPRFWLLERIGAVLQPCQRAFNDPPPDRRCVGLAPGTLASGKPLPIASLVDLCVDHPLDLQSVLVARRRWEHSGVPVLIDDYLYSVQIMPSIIKLHSV